MPVTTDHGARVVTVRGAHNVRDLGLLRLADGRRTATGRVYRGEFSLPPGRPPANDLALRTVVDLRRHGELTHESVEWAAAGVRLLHFPLPVTDSDVWTAKYTAYVEGRPERFTDAVRALADPANHPVLFHCAAGKDRTGAVAAVLLDLLGVVREDIAADYVQTGDTMPQVLARLREQEPYRESLTTSTIAWQTPRPETILALLEWLDGQGGAESWLLRHGMLPAEIAVLRDVMTEAGPG